MKPVYLGDAVYIQFDPLCQNFDLWTSNGVETTNRIVLEPETLRNLKLYLEEVGQL
jgi:hypothetical protein